MADDRHDLGDRLEALEAKLGRRRSDDAEKSRQTGSTDRSGFAQAFKLSSEFIAAIFVGAAIGYGIDVYFNTTPWGMIILLMLGFAAGILNVLRAAGMVAESGMRLHKVHELNADDTDETPRKND